MIHSDAERARGVRGLSGPTTFDEYEDRTGISGPMIGASAGNDRKAAIETGAVGFIRPAWPSEDGEVPAGELVTVIFFRDDEHLIWLRRWTGQVVALPLPLAEMKRRGIPLPPAARL